MYIRQFSCHRHLEFSKFNLCKTTDTMKTAVFVFVGILLFGKYF